MKLKPWKYQLASVKFMVSRAAAGIFLDPGLGKTLITYLAYLILRDKGYARGMLVVSKLRPTYMVWPAEIKKWNLDLKHVILHGGKKDQRLREKADVYLINYDGLAWLFRTLHSEKRWPFNMIVFDESSVLRNHSARTRFKLVKEYLGRFRRRYILTGSPAPRSLINLWTQIFTLDAGKRLGKFITHFRMRYCDAIQIPNGPITYEIREGKEAEIYRKIQDIVIRFDDSELDMPKLVMRTYEVELPRKARLAYDDLERDLITMIDHQVIVAKNAGVATGKLRQIANGGLYLKNDGDEKDRRWKKLHDEKTDAVLEIVEELEGQPVMIGYEFHHDLERLRAALPKSTPWVGGGVSMKRTMEIEAAWNRGDEAILLGQINAVSHGLNLQTGGRAVIFHSFVWDYEAYDQFIRRIRRQGQKARRVFCYHVVSKNTIDLPILASMTRKAGTQNSLFAALKEYASQRKKKRR